MKKGFLLILLFFPFVTMAIKKWTNTSGNSSWSTANNWFPVGVPLTTDDVVFDNTTVVGSYIVDLPVSATTINTLTIMPSAGNTIRIRLPAGNISSPGITLASSTGNIFIIKTGGIFENISGGAIPPSLGINGIVRIENGGRYIHNTSLTALDVVGNLSYVPGTELGVIEYAQGTSSSLLASGITYNSVELSTTSSKTFTIAGNGITTFRGFLMIDNSVNFNSTKVGSIFFGGDLIMNGNFSNIPPSAGTTDRSLEFTGSNQFISGPGAFTQGNNFRNFKIDKGATVTLLRSLNINNTASSTQDSIIVDTAATLKLGTNILSGSSNFRNYYASTISIGSPAGINALGNNTGNVQTTGSRRFDTSGNYEYNGTGPQVTGTGLPSIVRNLTLNKSDLSTLTLNNPVNVNDSLSLQGGYLSTSSSALPKLTDTTIIVSPSSVYSSQLGLNIGYKGSFILGPLARTISTKTVKWFPVGKVIGTDTLFAPVRLAKFNGNQVTDTVEYFYARHFDTAYSSPPLHHISKVEYWNVRGNVSGVDNTDTLLLTWRPQSRVGTGNPIDSTSAFNGLVTTHYFDDDGAGPHPIKWYIDGEPTTFIKAGSLNFGYLTTIIPLAATASFTLGTRSPYNLLPVRFIAFHGNATSAGNQIYWTTEDDASVSGYYLERSGDGITFEGIGSTASHHNIGRNEYELIDASTYYGWNFYRLRIIDQKANIYYSYIIRIWNANKRIVKIFPNPAGKYISISTGEQGSVTTLEIVNIKAEVVLIKEVTHAIEKINIEDLPNGIYFIRFRNHSKLINERFLKQ